MPTAVRDIEASQANPDPGDLTGYNRVLLLIRLGGYPIGQAWLPLTEGRLDPQLLQTAIEEASDRVLREPWLGDWLRSRSAAPATHATVAVCTRDRPEHLQKCLTSLLSMPDDGQEMLVIDNCPSSEESYNIVAASPRIRYVRENRPGLNVARNRAIREASNEIVAFIDDDARADPFWLRNLLMNFDGPLVAAATGLTMPFELETPAQEIYEQHSPFGRGFRRTRFESAQISPTSAGMVGAGVNMAMRRGIIQQIGFFNEMLDAGTATCSGGDYDLFTRVLAAGYQIVYDPAALSWHQHRRSWQEIRQTFYGYGVGVYAAYTHSLLLHGEFSVFKSAWGWFYYNQLPNLIHSLQHHADSVSLDLLLAEFYGCLCGPAAYLKARQHMRRI